MIRKAILPVWQAKWIDPELPHDAETKQPASYLRRRFTIKTLGSARLYITCHGLYAAYLNGQRVGDFVLAPGTGDYNQRLMVQCYDVTGLLKANENQLLVVLGDGWYRGGVGVDGLRNYCGADIALLCQLEMNGQPILCSDEHWEASQQGPIRENDLEIGEIYDARLEKISGWHRVTVRDYGFANLAPTESVPVLEQEHFPGKRMKTPNGDTVIDFGQNLAGYTEFRLTAKAGQKIILWHGETLDENGNFTQANYSADFRDHCPGVPQKIEYICKDGLNEWIKGSFPNTNLFLSEQPNIKGFNIEGIRYFLHCQHSEPSSCSYRFQLLSASFFNSFSSSPSRIRRAATTRLSSSFSTQVTRSSS